MGFGNGTDIHAILQPYDEKHRPPTEGTPEVGQVIQTVVPDIGQTWRVFDAQRSDQTSHASASGTIRNVEPDKDYRHKPNRLPLFKERLGDCQELLALTSKVRPCVVLAIADGIADKRLPEAQRNRARSAFMRPAALVAPMYSVSTPNEPRSVTATIAARAECLVYPQLVFLPRSGGIVRNDSVLRLDRAFWTTLPKPTELCALSLSQLRQAIMHGQLLTLQGRGVDQAYIDMVELLRGELAPEHAENLA
ncbi:hypothetical protein N792_03905 [Lysobacter concretionis Ko07 = DSM 16239]|uniref:Uncharacterized protein n=1 Tax=Lysobacter concretionis Ko07 = DSM 16239 TaxID=1122185 RepID=A0A0A0EPC3_9GAMM|nr:MULTISPECIES: hypothetical protein [Lysobacter]KGM52269.1 hypothetical protein N792_03905 [Lysobacter concretionis Ko07 = DSM 16239]QOD92001.1 hypothetical protein H2514_05070 [Lysobacter sp. CW239]